MISEPTIPPASDPTVMALSTPVPTLHRLGLAKSTSGKEIITYDIIHRSVAINPFGIRVKVGEWGAGPMLVIPLNHKLDFGPQINTQNGRTYVGVGYALRSKTPMVFVGHKF